MHIFPSQPGIKYTELLPFKSLHKLVILVCAMLAITTFAARSAEASVSHTGEGGTPDLYSSLDVHLGFENEASAERINFPLYIQLSEMDWRSYNEQFRQLGLLVDMWDQARRGDILLEDTRNVPLLGVDTSVMRRQIRIIRTNWNEVGEKCGYRSSGSPHDGCAFNKQLPRCTIVVPHQQIYAKGDINEYHNLLGHEMWHCLVGSFH